MIHCTIILLESSVLLYSEIAPQTDTRPKEFICISAVAKNSPPTYIRKYLLRNIKAYIVKENINSIRASFLDSIR